MKTSQIRLRVQDAPATGDVLAAYRVQLMNAHAKVHEERIQIVLNPKPKWLPRKTWGFLLRMLIRREFIR